MVISKKFFKDKKKIIALSDKRDFLKETLDKRMRGGIPNQDFYDELNQEIMGRISNLDNQFLNVNFVDILKGLEHFKKTYEFINKEEINPEPIRKQKRND